MLYFVYYLKKMFCGHDEQKSRTQLQFDGKLDSDDDDCCGAAASLPTAGTSLWFSDCVGFNGSCCFFCGTGGALLLAVCSDVGTV